MPLTKHFHGYKVLAGQRTACGRFIEEGAAQEADVTADVDAVTCGRCKTSSLFRSEISRRNNAALRERANVSG